MNTGRRLRAAAPKGGAPHVLFGMSEPSRGGWRDWRPPLRGRPPHVWLLAVGLCAAPASIAVAEILLCGALAFYLVELARGRAHVSLPRLFWIWLVWAALQIMACVRSGSLSKGGGELRHLGLIAALFLLLSTLNRGADRLTVWRGIFAVGAISCLVLVARFVARLLWYGGTLDPSVYLRGGGLLHHWMVFATVEVVIFAGLLEFWRSFPRERLWLAPVLLLQTTAIVFSLTRTLWLCCLLLLAIDLAWRRSRWLCALPALPCVLFLIAPNAVRTRIADSSQLEYYSNAERLQMLRVGWRMIRQHPLTGVGPGRVEELYPQYLRAGEPLPAYHGHLHNNVVQIAAQSGIPVAAAAILFAICLAWELKKRERSALTRHEHFICRAALLGLMGFTAAGMLDYTYGHSLGLILVCFVTLTPLTPASPSPLPASDAAADIAVRARSDSVPF
jgi:O-antigen ligase